MKQGIFYQAISKPDCGSAAQYVDRVFHQALKKLPAQSPAPNQVRASYSLIKAIRHAQAAQQSRGDTHLAVDQLILGLLEDSQITDLLKEVGVTPAKVKFEVKMLRGKKGKKMERKLDPVIGRDEEIRRVIRILPRRTKNNPVLIGEPAVGKTVVVEGLAQRIVRGDVPSNLADVRLVALDMGALIAGANRGELEERLCIGATTLEEHRKYIEKDAAFERRFQQVYVAEPSVPNTISILQGLKEKYEGHHGVRIQDCALVIAAQLSSRYITDVIFLTKQLIWFMEIVQMWELQLDSQPDQIDKHERKRMQLEVELHALEKENDKASKAQLVEVWKELDDLRDKLQPLKMKYRKEKGRVDEIRRLKQKRDKLILALQEAERRYDLAIAANLIYGEIQEVESTLAQIEGTAD
ncbi:hypothetical protein PVK06_003052 [Gossypium arboreum]|uniref:Clp R domain-containing protein n=1 Tax=Gossypium arboreum TaxID=29729 RepID=A0ABR0R6G0_GOSAR|nr:hypothetical protein PVK06_003052 [Gossypium arboreum]